MAKNWLFQTKKNIPQSRSKNPLLLCQSATKLNLRIFSIDFLTKNLPLPTPCDVLHGQNRSVGINSQTTDLIIYNARQMYIIFSRLNAIRLINTLFGVAFFPLSLSLFLSCVAICTISYKMKRIVCAVGEKRRWSAGWQRDNSQHLKDVQILWI